ncbi:hypothetical protein [Thiothrix eikelboomii]|uniref:hypothetical protein n=1 Tax=Thiothrix eikelboomii TaxID=92487 RepID=UPI003BAED37E
MAEEKINYPQNIATLGDTQTKIASDELIPLLHKEIEHAKLRTLQPRQQIASEVLIRAAR